MIGLAEDALSDLALQQEDLLAALVMVVGPFPVSMLLSLWAKLPRWWLMSVMGPVAVGLLLLLVLVSPAVSTNLGEWGSRLAFMGVGALGFALAAAAMLPVRLRTRVVVVAVVGVLGLAGVLGRGWVVALGQGAAAARAGIPVVVPEVPGYRLAYVNVSGGELSLRYESARGEALEVDVRAMGGVGARERCVEGHVRLDACREVVPGVWVDDEDVDVGLAAEWGGASVRVRSSVTTQTDLLQVLGSLRAVGWWELAWQ
ncbi:hypothetical protein [Nonomuraea gerenzanensis]|uniref:hypothetical protein n=1 Tax=Nonomuraea gerenzanensis TaxID=93944 RepID=UPI001CD99133|nr:hypothetical protein [Nonomuraea gerenzanensis]UBU12142.1 hypothetical protein LCN96_48915 [Nonomuraea gerenzanensis]